MSSISVENECGDAVEEAMSALDNYLEAREDAKQFKLLAETWHGVPELKRVADEMESKADAEKDSLHNAIVDLLQCTCNTVMGDED